MNTETAAFLNPGRIGPLTLANRMVRAATSESMAEPDGAVNDALVALYRDLGWGGAGLIITGHIYVERRGQYTPRQMGIDRDERVTGLRRLTDAVHAAGRHRLRRTRPCRQPVADARCGAGGTVGDPQRRSLRASRVRWTRMISPRSSTPSRPQPGAPSPPVLTASIFTAVTAT